MRPCEFVQWLSTLAATRGDAGIATIARSYSDPSGLIASKGSIHTG